MANTRAMADTLSSSSKDLADRQFKQPANALKGKPPIPAIRAAKQFDFPDVYIFSEASGEPIYIGESQRDSQGADNQLGIVNRC